MSEMIVHCKDDAICNIPSESITPNSLICGKYPDALNKSSEQTSQVIDFRQVETHPPFDCSNTKKTEVVETISLTLEEIQKCFLKSSQCNSYETICSLPFLSGLFKLNIGVSDETLNISVLKVINSSLEENITKNISLFSNASDNLIVPSEVIPSNTESEASQPDIVNAFPYLNKKNFKSSADSLNGTELDPIQNDPQNQMTGFSVLESNYAENIQLIKNSYGNQNIANENDVQDLSEIIHFPQEHSDGIQKESFQNSSTLRNFEQFNPQTNAELMEIDFPMNGYDSETFLKDNSNKGEKQTILSAKSIENLILTPEMIKTVDKVLSEGNPDKEMCKINSHSLYRRDFESLSGSKWLNDVVINSFLDIIVQRSVETVYAFNTFFYSTLKSKGFESVSKWTTKDIFNYKLNFIPIHLPGHWCLAVVDHHEKKIQYFDSMGENEKQCLDILQTYLQAEHQDKRGGIELDTYAKEIMMDVPQQRNGFDCGMFVLMFAEYISRGAEITFDQSHMPYLRKKIIFELYQGHL